LFIVFAGKKQPKHVGNMPEIRKKNTSQNDDIFIILAKCSNFEVSSLGLELQISRLGLVSTF